MVFQKKGGVAGKRSFSQANEKVPKKVFTAEEEDDDEEDIDMEDDSDLDDSDSDDASDSRDAIGKLNAKQKQTPTQGKNLMLLKTGPKGQIQSPGLTPGKKNQLTGSAQKQSMQAKLEFLGMKNQGKKKIEREAVEVDSDEDDDDDDDDLDDDDDSDSGDKVNAKGKQTPQGKGLALKQSPKGQTPALSTGKKNQVATPAKQNSMKEFPGIKGSAKKTMIRQAEKDDEDDDDDDEDDDEDDDDESEDDKPKTPSAVNKSAVKKESNGKKDMHVSFELPQKGAVKGKSQQNTPVQAKKSQQAPTPGPQQGKSAKQTGKAAPGKGKKQESDDDEDDEDDLSDEEDEDMDDDDEDDDDEDGDEDDDDDDDEDDDKVQEVIKKKIASLKKDMLPKKEKVQPEAKNKKGKTLLKNQGDSKDESKGKSPAQQKAVQESLEYEQQRKRERDVRNLFVKGLPPDITVDEIKALSPDILDVSLPKSKFQKKKGVRALFGFLEFANEQKAEENYVKLQKKKLRGQELLIDYSGEKSKNKTVSSAAPERNVNRKKLFVSALPEDVTMAEVAQLFPHSYCITLNNAPEYRNCTVLFHTEEEAAQAFKANEKPKIKGRAISVLYALEKATPAKRHKGHKRPFQGKQNSNPASKRMKM